MAAKDFDVAELLSTIVDIARAGQPGLNRWKRDLYKPSHIAWEFHKCANSSAGSIEEHTLFPRPPTPTPAPASPSGGAPSVLHIEDTWWKQQDADPNWINQWDHDDENTDPKSWK